ncbi:MAG: hypothetical protein HN909_00155 [Phycisphaerales bacterium]|jgi:enamine deaminase RidA (YjgF/YER057c/UK114 family)|nr:hypothetical protein [Phycisphaerales bacterium]MBT7170163.1 hypothetical protein [Phycisphaerales bacterium]
MAPIDVQIQTADAAVASLASNGVTEYFITTTSDATTPIAEQLSVALGEVAARNAEIVVLNIFAPLDQQVDLPEDIPTMWVDSGHTRGSNLSGLQVHAISGATLERISLDGQTVGTVYSGPFGRYCRMTGIGSADTSADRYAQAISTYERMEAALKLAGMEFSDVIRTWLYLADILDWYDEFNAARDEYFTGKKTFDKLVPASTGIGGHNHYGAAMNTGLMAIQPTDGAIMQEIASPLQCSALDYGSSFSRAAELTGPDELKRLWISGTASIEPEGATVFLDDIAGQIDMTMKVIEAILESREMTYADCTRAIAYFKEAAFLDAWRSYVATRPALAAMPCILTENDVCRDDLLFEIELDAITK